MLILNIYLLFLFLATYGINCIYSIHVYYNANKWAFKDLITQLNNILFFANKINNTLIFLVKYYFIVSGIFQLII